MIRYVWLPSLLWILICTSVLRAQVGDELDTRRSIVRVISTIRSPNWIQPWQRLPPERAFGSGAIIEGNRILTSAHVVMYATQVDVQPFQGAETFPATVVGLAPGMDLAVLKIQDEHFFNAQPALKLSQEFPAVRDNVSIYGYPIGGVSLSITRGAVSRIEFATYGYGEGGLRVEISAGINPGSSGGPVIADGQLLGLVFATTPAQNTAYVIPAEEIRLFLDDIGDGTYDGKPQFWEDVQSLRNRALRARLGLETAVSGVLVREAYRSDADYLIRKGDVISAVGEYEIDSVGMVQVDESLRLAFPSVLPKLADRDAVSLTVLRAGQKTVVNYPVRQPDRSLLRYLKGTEPSYFIWGPLAFSPATGELIESLEAVAPYLPAIWAARSSPMVTRRNDFAAFDDEQLVLVTSMFPHRITDGYTNVAGQVVTHVNGVRIQNLRHLVETVRDSKDRYVEIDFAEKYVETLVVDRVEAEAATQEVLADNSIRQQFSPDLHDIWPAAR